MRYFVNPSSIFDLEPQSDGLSLILQAPIKVNNGIFPCVVFPKFLLNPALVGMLHVEQAAEELQVDDIVTGLEVDVAVVVSIGFVH